LKILISNVWRTQYEAAIALHMSETKLSSIIRGRAEFSDDEYARLVAAVGKKRVEECFAEKEAC